MLLTLADIYRLTYRDLAHASLNNDKVSNATLLESTNLGYRAWATRVGCFARQITIPVVSGTAQYTKSKDIYDLRLAGYDTWASILDHTTVGLEMARDIHWRTIAAGTPLRYVQEDDLTLTLVPAQSAFIAPTTHNILLDALIQPHSCGAGIASIIRAANVVTVTTNSAHNLAAGNSAVIYGVTDALTTHFDGTFTIATAPTATTLTYAQTGDAGSGTAATGLVGYSGGILPLYKTTDAPQFDTEFHEALVHFNVWALASGLLADEQEGIKRMDEAGAQFEAKIAKYKNEVA